MTTTRRPNRPYREMSAEQLNETYSDWWGRFGHYCAEVDYTGVAQAVRFLDHIERIADQRGIVLIDRITE